MHRHFMIGQAENWIFMFIMPHHKTTLMFKNPTIFQNTKIGGFISATTWVIIKFITEITASFETPFAFFSEAGHFMSGK
jgi:hypothetical protein